MIGTVSMRMPSASAHASASSRLSGEENGDGIATARTASAPSASTARVAVNAESIPPDSPSTTSPNPFLRT